MITTLVPVLAAAQKGGFAVPAFNCYNLETIQAVIIAAEKQGSAVIIGVSMSALDYGGPALMAAARTAATAATIPVVIHLDHFTDLKKIEEGFRWGASSAMFDGSHLPLIENMAKTIKAVRIARHYRASVEGELGAIGGQEDGVLRARPTLVNPEEAVYFAHATKVAALALGLGTSHGLPVPQETVDIPLLDTVRQKVTTPIVLHGASNLPPRIIRAGIRHGIVKINIDTELRQAFTDAVRLSLTDKPDNFNPRVYLSAGREAVTKRAMALIRLFGGVNTAHAIRRHW